jgi:hypothetical protein
VQGVGTDYTRGKRAANGGSTQFCYDIQTEDMNIPHKHTVQILSGWVVGTCYFTTKSCARSSIAFLAGITTLGVDYTFNDALNL